MACSECKKKRLSNDNNMDAIVKTASTIGKYVIGFVIVWSALAIYGLYTLLFK